MQQRNEDTRLQLQGANNRAWGQVAIGPTATVAPLAPTMQKPDYLGLALGIGSAVGGGLMKGNANKPPPGWSDQFKNAPAPPMQNFQKYGPAFGDDYTANWSRVNGFNLNVK
jgi:hypothetical protein